MALLVVLLPFVALALRRVVLAAGARGHAAIAVAFLAALFSWFVWKGDAHVQTWAWIPADEGPTATVGVLLDPLSNAMLVLVTLVSLLVQIYSLAYLRPSDGARSSRSRCSGSSSPRPSSRCSCSGSWWASARTS